MARSLLNAKLPVASIADGLSLSVFRRGYAAAAAPISAAVTATFGSGGSRAGGMTGKVEDRAATKEDSEAYSTWAPDPVTGYYRPANHAAEIDPAELRDMLLNRRVRPQ
ncbi:LATE EMBRYOGENIS ABUNDANT PROTEIN 41 [Salix purpurea]|uniref:LATE EMBRYOGENIS ABUNDANT PROTEIN 41 n=1 Tax=Salix purpurea TaxID=77065 RepID=A0A9Q0Z3I3_SALPP|nr:LATE EMBRYOGENIS ABUNDANT PROTEIN 41 [Salix purpurea]